MIDPTLTWKDIDWLSSVSPLPLVLKGIMTGEDAKLAVAHNAKGIVVSNHGGRQLDDTVGTLDALPEVVEAVQGQVEVLVDGGIRRVRTRHPQGHSTRSSSRPFGTTDPMGTSPLRQTRSSGGSRTFAHGTRFRNGPNGPKNHRRDRSKPCATNTMTCLKRVS